MRCPPFPALVLCLGLFPGCNGDRDLPPAYRGVEVPHARLASARARERGRALFLEHCALCHGEGADGRGVRRSLSSRPADFTDPSWRRRTSPRRIFWVIREGVRGTAMPAWKVLDESETWDLVAYLLSVAEGPESEGEAETTHSRTSATAKPIRPSPTAEAGTAQGPQELESAAPDAPPS